LFIPTRNLAFNYKITKLLKSWPFLNCS